MEIGILLRKDEEKKKRGSISNKWDKLNDIPPSSFAIPVMFFYKLDTERLYKTIESIMEKNDKQVM